MSHIALSNLAAADPRTARLRKRKDRKLRPVRTGKVHEMWLRGKLGSLSDQLRRAGSDLADELKTSWPRGVMVGCTYDGAVAPAVTAQLAQFERRFQNLSAVVQKWAAQAAGLSLAHVDDRIVKAVAASVKMDISPALTMAGPISAAVREEMTATADAIEALARKYISTIRTVVTGLLDAFASVASVLEGITYAGATLDTESKVLARQQAVQMTTRFNRVRQESMGVQKYRWETADSELATSHGFLNGAVFRWDSPTEIDGAPVTPGMGTCRCVAVPLFDLDAPQAPQWLIDALAQYPRIAIAGGPRTGKSSVSGFTMDRPVIHTDDFMDQPWDQVPALVIAEAQKRGESFVVEGVQVPRALRAGLQVDLVIWLDKPLLTLTPAQAGMTKGVTTVFEDWLAKRTVQTPVLRGTL